MNKILILLLVLFSFSFADWTHNPISVNGSENPGTWNQHYMNGYPKIARIGNTVVLLGQYNGGERLYRSTDNGDTWTQIDQNTNTYSNTVVSGRDSIFYYFIRSGNNLQMIKFYKDGTPPAPVTIYSNSAISTHASGVAAYVQISATIDSTGKIYLFAHYGNPDDIFVLSSLDSGTTWSGPYEVTPGGSSPFYQCAGSVTPNNVLMLVYQIYSANTIWFGKSYDGGLNWTRTQVTSALGANPTPLCFGDSIYVFKQNGTNACQWSRSADEGATWSAFATIETTIGYGDPTGSIGSDSTIYVAFRSSNGSGLGGGGGARYKSRFAQSTNWGSTWTFPDTDGYTDFTERTVERCHVRYQTWFNYGGILEWFWGQYMSSGSQYVTYYDCNTGMTILDQSGGEPPSPPEINAYKIKIISMSDTTSN